MYFCAKNFWVEPCVAAQALQAADCLNEECGISDGWLENKVILISYCPSGNKACDGIRREECATGLSGFSIFSWGPYSACLHTGLLAYRVNMALSRSVLQLSAVAYWYKSELN